ncbi:MAG TPA: PIN domain-containing protein, partial [Pyrinomonadaceae bacterium]|nr:PIN domain-containing protein [Pyrinomonadaceae bacterium]
MNDYVADTHSLYWFLTASPRLGANAKSAFDEAQNGLAFIHISAIVLAELYYLNSKYSSPIDFAVEFQRLKAGSQYVLTPIDPDDIVDFYQDHAVSEMHDRIIVGLARRLNAPLLTVDKIIVAS